MAVSIYIPNNCARGFPFFHISPAFIVCRLFDDGQLKNESRTLSNTIHKNKLKWIKDLDLRPETVKLLEENISRTLSDINHTKILCDLPPRVMEIKTKINKWDLIKLKSFCAGKEAINKMKRQPSK